MKRYIYILTTILAMLLVATPEWASAQKSAVDKQNTIVEKHKRDLEAAQRRVNDLNNKTSNAQERLNELVREMNLHASYIAEVDKQRSLLNDELLLIDSAIMTLDSLIDGNRALYAEVVRVAYRNYQNHNQTTYLLSSKSMSEFMMRTAQLKRVAEQQQQLAETITAQRNEVNTLREKYMDRKHQLDSVGNTLESERTRLDNNRRKAQKEFTNLTAQQREAVKDQKNKEKSYNKEVAKLRELSKRLSSASYSTATSDNLPVDGGRLQRIARTSTVKILGKKGATVRSNFEGEVLAIEYDSSNHKTVVVGNSRYLASYSRLGTINVKEGDKVSRDQKIGTVGIVIDHNGTESAYIQFTLIDLKTDAEVDAFKYFNAK